MIENDSALFKVDVENYAGPLEVLLDLAKAQKVNLEDISITKLADQFHDFITKEKNLNLEVASEYLLMATWLSYLKSKLLLPDTPEEEFEAAKRRRRKELAFLYGVDESLIEGEMDNPFYTGSFMNTGGIASLDMEMGGDVSGPGGPKDDMIDAKLSDGEFVMTAKAVENFGNGSRMEGAKRMYKMMNKLDPESEKMGER